MVPQLFLLQDFLLLGTDQVKVWIPFPVMNVLRIQTVPYAPGLQFADICTADLGHGLDSRKPLVNPIMGQEGDLPAKYAVLPSLYLLSAHPERHDFLSPLPRCLLPAIAKYHRYV